MACCANTYDKLIHVYGVVSACFDYGNKLWFLIAREHIAHVTHFRRWPTSQDIYYYSSVSAMSEFFRRRCQKKSKQVNRCRSFKTTPKQCDINFATSVSRREAYLHDFVLTQSSIFCLYRWHSNMTVLVGGCDHPWPDVVFWSLENAFTLT